MVRTSWFRVRLKFHAQRYMSRTLVIKPPGKRMSGFALLVKETKKPLREVAAMWHNLPDTAKEVRDAPLFTP